MFCEICGKREATETHHLIGNRANRKLSDQDGLTLKICRECHHTIHNNGTAEHLSKMLGQCLYEKDHTREEFLKRYGKGFL